MYGIQNDPIATNQRGQKAQIEKAIFQNIQSSIKKNDAEEINNQTKRVVKTTNISKVLIRP